MNVATHPTSAANNIQLTAEGLVEPALISVIVPIYNVASTLHACLMSIQRQSYSKLEILCIIDGATDSSAAIAEEFAQADERFRVIKKSNSGYGASCNRGLSEAQGSWIAFVEPDDYLEPGFFAALINGPATAHADIIKSPYWELPKAGLDTQETASASTRVLSANTSPHTIKKVACAYRGRVNTALQPFTIDQAPELLQHHPSIWSALYRRAFLKERDIHFVEAPGAGWTDNPFFVATLCQAHAIAYVDTPGYCYRVDSPEQARSFFLKSPKVPLQRWLESIAELRRAQLSNPAAKKPEVVQAIYRRGLNYLEQIMDAHPDAAQRDPVIDELAQRMCHEMKTSLVLECSRISPQAKELFCYYTQQSYRPTQKLYDNLRYRVQQAHELRERVSAQGFKASAQLVAHKLKTKRLNDK